MAFIVVFIISLLSLGKAQLFASSNGLSQMLFIAENSLYSSWNQGASWQTVGGNLGEFFASVTSDASGKHWYAVSSTGLLVSSNSGKTWTKSFVFETQSISSNQCGNIASDGSGQYVLGGITVLKHGSNGFVYYSCSIARSADYGKKWTVVDQSFTYVSGSLSGDVFAMLADTNTSVVYLSNDFGSTWRPSGVARFNSNVVTLKQVYVQSNNTVLAVGYSTSSIVICRFSENYADCTCSTVVNGKGIYKVYVEPFTGQSISILDYNFGLHISFDYGYTFRQSAESDLYSISQTNVVVGKMDNIYVSSYFSLANSSLNVYTNQSGNFLESALKYTCQPGFAVYNKIDGECIESGSPCSHTNGDGNVVNAYNDGTSIELSKKCSNFPTIVPNVDVSGCYRFCNYPYKCRPSLLNQQSGTMSCHDYYHGSCCTMVNLELPRLIQAVIIGSFVVFYLIAAVYCMILCGKTKSGISICNITKSLIAFCRDTLFTYMDTFTDLLFITTNDFSTDVIFYLSVVFYLIHPICAACSDVVRNFRFFWRSWKILDLKDANNLPLFLLMIIIFILHVAVNLILFTPWFLLLILAHSTRLIAIHNVSCLLRPLDHHSGYLNLHQIVNDEPLPMLSNVLASEKNYGYILESLPQLILNVMNSYLLNKINTIALISMAFSGFMLLNGIYSSVHRICFRRRGDISKVNALFLELNERGDTLLKH